MQPTSLEALSLIMLLRSVVGLILKLKPSVNERGKALSILFKHTTFLRDISRLTVYLTHLYSAPFRKQQIVTSETYKKRKITVVVTNILLYIYTHTFYSILCFPIKLYPITVHSIVFCLIHLSPMPINRAIYRSID
jgi:hypothetical protein